MALTRTFSIATDTLLGKSGSTPVGGGNDEHLPIGVGGGYDFKAALKFNHDWTGMTRIVSARLYMRTTTKVHATTWGASPTIIVERNASGNFTENSGRSSYDSPAGSGWSGSATDFDGANVGNGVDDVSWGVGNNESTWYSVDITGIVNSWAPASVLRSTGTPGGGAANYGIIVRPSSYATSETVEFSSRESAYNPYIVVTYESNTAPNAPTVPSPASPSTTASQTPTLSWLYDDPQSDASSKYQVQVATDAGFTALVHDSGEVALVQADNTTMSRVWATAALTRGVTYYWRVKVADAAGLFSAWSSTWNFTVNTLPVVALTEPSATGRIARVTYLAGAGWAQPRLYVEWSYSDAQGQAQTQYELEVIRDNAGAPTGTVVQSGVVSGAATSVVVAGALLENTRYHVRVRAYDGLEWSAWSGYYIVRARWGYTVHKKDVSIAGVAPQSWSIQTLNAPVTGSQLVVVEYNSDTDGAGTGLGVWQSSLGAVTKNKWFYYRVWFMCWGASPATLPSLLDLTLRTSGQTIQPERWLPSPIASHKGTIELSDRVFGTQSLRIDCDGSPHYITQQVRVDPGEDYVLQGRIRSIGNSGAKVYLSDTQNGPPLAGAETAAATGDLAWEQRISSVWNSGSRSAVWVTCYANGPTGAVALFDGLKAERGRVTSPWTPGLVGQGVAIDSGGIQVDATNASGAIFRLRTSGGNVIELGPDTLYLDGEPIGSAVGDDVELLRYVPIAPNVTLSGLGVTTSITANTGIVHTPVITGIPVGAVGVSLQLHARHSVVTASHRFNIYGYDAALTGAAMKAQLISGKVVNHYEALTCHYVPLGGDRQFDYEVQIGVAGTSVFDASITGYWVKDQSALLTGGTQPDDVFVQAGTVNVVFAAVGNASTAVVFPIPYPSAPVVTVTARDASTLLPGTLSVTATGFTATLRHYDNTAQTVTIVAQWIAVGPRP